MDRYASRFRLTPRMLEIGVILIYLLGIGTGRIITPDRDQLPGNMLMETTSEPLEEYNYDESNWPADYEYSLPIRRPRRRRRYIHESATDNSDEPKFNSIPDYHECEWGGLPRTKAQLEEDFVVLRPELDDVADLIGNFAYFQFHRKCASHRCGFIKEILTSICVPSDYPGNSGVIPYDVLPKDIPSGGHESRIKGLPFGRLLLLDILTLYIIRPSMI